MKLTDNQKAVIGTLLSRSEFYSLLSCWEMAEDRNLVLDELLELCKKLKIKIRQEHAKNLRIFADRGKK